MRLNNNATIDKLLVSLRPPILKVLRGLLDLVGPRGDLTISIFRMDTIKLLLFGGIYKLKRLEKVRLEWFYPELC